MAQQYIKFTSFKHPQYPFSTLKIKMAMPPPPQIYYAYRWQIEKPDVILEKIAIFFIIKERY
jgi:hypothetical protein